MTCSIRSEATRAVIALDGVDRAAFNEDGSMELLTPPSVPTGKMVTTINQFGSSLSANGWQKLPSGLIIQWGSLSAPSGTSTFVYPITFPNNVFSVVITPSGAYSTAVIESAQVITAITKSNVSVRNALVGDGVGTVETVSVKIMMIGY